MLTTRATRVQFRRNLFFWEASFFRATPIQKHPSHTMEWDMILLQNRTPEAVRDVLIFHPFWPCLPSHQQLTPRSGSFISGPPSCANIRIRRLGCLDPLAPGNSLSLFGWTILGDPQTSWWVRHSDEKVTLNKILQTAPLTVSLEFAHKLNLR